MMRFNLVYTTVLWLAATCVGAQDLPPVHSALELADGDTFVFLGDSITHQCLYTQYIEDYFYTRYPNTHIRFHNSGVGGDTAADALARFDQDVASFKPKYVSILLGMNDGRYRHFDHDVFKTYETDMTTLLDRIATLGSRAVPMGPSMFDARVARLRAKNPSPDDPRINYYDAVLAFYGTWLQQQAVDRGLGFVNVFTPLHQITRQQRETDPKFNMIPDAVHPNASGHAVMASALLNDMHSLHVVSNVTAVRRGDKWAVNAVGGKANSIAGDNQQLEFSFQANALPWVLPEEAQPGYEFAKAGHKLSNERLRVVGLEMGSYALTIDGQAVGQFSNMQLNRGIELQNNTKTPQYQQALRIAMLNKERNDQAVHPLRNQWGGLKGQRRGLQRWLATHADDKDGAAKRKAAFEEWQKTFQQRVTELLDKVRQYDQQIYAANKPPARVYTLEKITKKP